MKTTDEFLNGRLPCSYLETELISFARELEKQLQKERIINLSYLEQMDKERENKKKLKQTLCHFYDVASEYDNHPFTENWLSRCADEFINLKN